MSAIRTNKSTTAFGKKPFCKVCFDAKKPESEYTSHFVRSLPDMNGKTIVTCPVLNATECRYCYNFGHTAKFCPVLEENKKKEKKAKSVAIKAEKAAEALLVEDRSILRNLSVTYKGKFAGLNNDSDDEIEQPVAKEAGNFPTLNNFAAIEKAAEGLWRDDRSILVNISKITHPTNNWAAIAAKPAVPSFKPAPKVVEAPAKSWADESDSEEEEEEVETFPAMPFRTTSMFTAASYMKEEEDEFANAPVITRTTSVRIPENGRRFVDDDEDW